MSFTLQSSPRRCNMGTFTVLFATPCAWLMSGALGQSFPSPECRKKLQRALCCCAGFDLVVYRRQATINCNMLRKSSPVCSEDSPNSLPQQESLPPPPPPPPIEVLDGVRGAAAPWSLSPRDREASGLRAVNDSQRWHRVLVRHGFSLEEERA